VTLKMDIIGEGVGDERDLKICDHPGGLKVIADSIGTVYILKLQSHAIYATL